MAAPGEKSFCVLGYHTSKSVVTVQRVFRAKYAKVPSTDKTILAWYKQFTETGCLCKQKSSGRPLTSEDNVEWVQASFLHSPRKSTGTAAKEQLMLKRAVWRVLCKRLPCDLADLNARIIAAVKHIDAPMCGKNLNIVSLCAVSPVVHTANISSCQKKLFQFSCGCKQFH